jgi:hypothetical protein
VVVLASDRAGCAGAGATVGRRYTEAAAALSGGSLASLCAADWTTSLAPITAQLAGQRSYYPLAGKPDPASLEVTVAGRGGGGGLVVERHHPRGALRGQRRPGAGRGGGDSLPAPVPVSPGLV